MVDLLEINLPLTTTQGIECQDMESQNMEYRDMESRDVESWDVESRDVESADQSANNPSLNSKKKCFKNFDKSICFYAIIIIIMIAIVVCTVYITDIFNNDLCHPNPGAKGGNCTSDFENINLT